jgi:hypothetical protein
MTNISVQNQSIVSGQNTTEKITATDQRGASKAFHDQIMGLFSDYMDPEKDWTHRIHVPASKKNGSAAVSFIFNQAMNDWSNFQDFLINKITTQMKIEQEAGRLAGG